MKIILAGLFAGTIALNLGPAGQAAAQDAPTLLPNAQPIPQPVEPQAAGAESAQPQGDPAPQDGAPPQDQGASQGESGAQLNRPELAQLLAPIALYPDSLLAQILMAATYPLQVVEADRWLQEPQNAALKGTKLASAMEQENWDPSVKALIAFPRILHMMDLNLGWTEQLGDAFGGDQQAVMNAVQMLRQRAKSAGTFRSNAEQVVTEGPQVLSLASPNPDVVDVPAYNPWNAYGPWDNNEYPPYYFPDAFAGVGYDDFGLGWYAVPVFGPLWGWNYVDWHAHRIVINRARWTALNGNRPPVGDSDVWRHATTPYRAGLPSRANAAPTVVYSHEQYAPLTIIRPQAQRAQVQRTQGLRVAPATPLPHPRNLAMARPPINTAPRAIPQAARPAPVARAPASVGADRR